MMKSSIGASFIGVAATAAMAVAICGGMGGNAFADMAAQEAETVAESQSEQAQTVEPAAQAEAEAQQETAQEAEAQRETAAEPEAQAAEPQAEPAEAATAAAQPARTEQTQAETTVSAQPSSSQQTASASTAKAHEHSWAASTRTVQTGTKTVTDSAGHYEQVVTGYDYIGTCNDCGYVGYSDDEMWEHCESVYLKELNKKNGDLKKCASWSFTEPPKYENVWVDAVTHEEPVYSEVTTWTCSTCGATK